jgi:hypothetical protein
MRILVAGALAACGGASVTVHPEIRDGSLTDSNNVDAATDAPSGPPWVSVMSGQLPPLASVWAASPTDVWIGGASMLSHYDGTSWTPAIGAPSFISGIWGTASDVWAWNIAEIGHQTAGSWEWMDLGWSAGIAAIRGSSPSDVWRVQRTGVIEHWDGSEWTSTTTGNGNLAGVYAADAHDAWASSSTGVLAWSGTAWAPAALPQVQYGDIAGTGADDVWVGAPGGGVYHWNGAWSFTSTGADTVTRISAYAPDDAWAIGCASSSSCADALHWDGAAWTATTVMNINAAAIVAVGPSQAWMVGVDPANPFAGVAMHN